MTNSKIGIGHVTQKAISSGIKIIPQTPRQVIVYVNNNKNYIQTLGKTPYKEISYAMGADLLKV